MINNKALYLKTCNVINIIILAVRDFRKSLLYKKLNMHIHPSWNKLFALCILINKLNKKVFYYA